MKSQNPEIPQPLWINMDWVSSVDPGGVFGRGFFWGAQIAFIESSNQAKVPSGLGLPPQIGYDFGIKKLSIGFHARWFIFKNMFQGLLVLRIGGGNDR